MLFTDGWTDALLPGGERVGTAGLLAAASLCDTGSAAAFRAGLLRRYEEGSGAGAFGDDASLVVLRKSG